MCAIGDIQTAIDAEYTEIEKYARIRAHPYREGDLIVVATQNSNPAG